MKIGEEEQRAGKGSKDRGAEGKKEKKRSSNGALPVWPSRHKTLEWPL